jgi:hypothetical protein
VKRDGRRPQAPSANAVIEVVIVPQSTGLTVRQFERESLELPIELTVCDEHAAQVRFSASSSAASQRVVHGTLMDVSPGGVGVQCGQFLPRMLEGIIRVMDAAGQVIFEHRVKVRRVYLTEREPVYSLGLAFVDPRAGIEKQVYSLLAGRGEGKGKKSPDRGGRHA